MYGRRFTLEIWKKSWQVVDLGSYWNHACHFITVVSDDQLAILNSLDAIKKGNYSDTSGPQIFAK